MKFFDIFFKKNNNWEEFKLFLTNVCGLSFSTLIDLENKSDDLISLVDKNANKCFDILVKNETLTMSHAMAILTKFADSEMFDLFVVNLDEGLFVDDIKDNYKGKTILVAGQLQYCIDRLKTEDFVYKSNKKKVLILNVDNDFTINKKLMDSLADYKQKVVVNYYRQNNNIGEFEGYSITKLEL